MRARVFFAVVSILLVATGCKKSKKPADSPSNSHSSADHKSADKPEAVPSVEVPADGKKFDPAIAAANVPDGAWYCNMGGHVHYAATDKQDGHCPICNMKLTKKHAPSTP